MVTWTADDSNGQSVTCIQTVTVEDNQAPTITCPSDVTVDTDMDACSATGVVLGAATADDNCTTITPTTNAPARYDLGTNMVTWTADDGNGQSVTCMQSVTVEDNQAPSISCPTDVIVSTDTGLCTHNLAYDISSSDNCSGAPAIAAASFAGEFNGSYYYLTNQDFNWQNAAAFATAAGGHLVSIGDAPENAFVFSLVAGTGSRWYIGLNDFASEGNYVWESGEPLVYTNWGAGQPDNFQGIEDGIVMTNSGQWMDCLLYTSPSPRDLSTSRMPSSA